MSLLSFCQWLADTPGSIALHESLFMYPLVESVHVLTLCLFVGMSTMLDLRLLGLTLRRVPLTDITNRLFPWMFAGFAVMVVTGVALFYAIPVRSYQSIWFRMKVVTPDLRRPERLDLSRHHLQERAPVGCHGGRAAARATGRHALARVLDRHHRLRSNDCV